MRRMLLGIPTVLIVKFCSKALAKCTLPMVSNAVGIPIKSTTGVCFTQITLLDTFNAIFGRENLDVQQTPNHTRVEYIHKFICTLQREAFDIDRISSV